MVTAWQYLCVCSMSVCVCLTSFHSTFSPSRWNGRALVFHRTQRPAPHSWTIYCNFYLRRSLYNGTVIVRVDRARAQYERVSKWTTERKKKRCTRCVYAIALGFYIGFVDMWTTCICCLFCRCRRDLLCNDIADVGDVERAQRTQTPDRSMLGGRCVCVCVCQPKEFQCSAGHLWCNVESGKRYSVFEAV